ncbi:hypothetical protein DACRYDRAFT_116545 [Dacryopinax primogenitus]|uniref:Peroxin-3 n=1 Tax=Dacryopinax primogenitus (strain DJM 731) TaxID=1858805 RepID=M5FXX3_DACPD|nr:uncharacterized protein DACRYDRAFT_116545 [Dacryopinax primogenitus]EJU01369.1 hypothetical protein DACRYDRAFT_116545 [Dacryopinax primogenitus]
MFTKIKNYVYERRNAIGAVAGVAAGVYVVKEYISDRLAELREGVMEDMEAKNNLRKRFEQNQDDCAFIVEALLPTFATDILREMDVERITQQLSSMRDSSRLSMESSVSVSSVGPSSQGSPTSPTSLPERGRPRQPQPAVDTTIMAPIMPVLSGATPAGEHPPVLLEQSYASVTTTTTESGESWVQQFEASRVVDPGRPEGPERNSSLSVRGHSPPYSSSADHSGEEGSVMTGSMISAGGSEGEVSGVFIPSVTVESSDEASGTESRPPVRRQTKAELWNEMKVLTFTRLLTIIYTTSLLTLLSRVQLNVLGRQKYVDHIIQLEAESRATGRDPIMELLYAWMYGDESQLWPEQWEKEGVDREWMTPELERRYLTFSWWLLHVGWKEVGERVRKAVEAVFEPVSPRQRLRPEEVERLIEEVRKRVEFDAEERTKRVNFLSILLPSTAADASYVLSQNGLSPPELEPYLQHLLTETASLLATSDMDTVLGECFDCATRACFSALEPRLRRADAGKGGAEGARLASVLPVVSKWAQEEVFVLPNLFVQAINGVRELEGVAAIIWAGCEDSESCGVRRDAPLSAEQGCGLVPYHRPPESGMTYRLRVSGAKGFPTAGSSRERMECAEANADRRSL